MYILAYVILRLPVRGMRARKRHVYLCIIYCVRYYFLVAYIMRGYNFFYIMRGYNFFFVLHTYIMAILHRCKDLPVVVHLDSVSSNAVVSASNALNIVCTA